MSSIYDLAKLISCLGCVARDRVHVDKTKQTWHSKVQNRWIIHCCTPYMLVRTSSDNSFLALLANIPVILMGYLGVGTITGQIVAPQVSWEQR